MQSVRNTWKNRTTCSFRFVTHRDDEWEKLSGLKNIEHGLCLVVRNINSYFVHHLNS